MIHQKCAVVKEFCDIFDVIVMIFCTTACIWGLIRNNENNSLVKSLTMAEVEYIIKLTNTR